MTMTTIPQERAGTHAAPCLARPLAIDLFCGLFGWGSGFLAEGYQVIGFDLEQKGTVPDGAQLVLQDVLTLHGAQFRDAACIVASPPCQAYSYRAMPWKRAKSLPPPDNSLFDACFRIQWEACEAAGHYIPMVVENVKGAQPWVGRARWHYGSFYLWGDVPALMPIGGVSKGMSGLRGMSHPGGGNKRDLGGPNDPRRFNSRSLDRKAASAAIAKIPFPLANHIARCFKPEGVSNA